MARLGAVGMDIDGVLARAPEYMLAAIQARGYLPHVTMEQVTRYDWYDAFPNCLPEGLIREIIGSEGFLTDMEPCPWLVEAARAVAAAGFTIEAVTARYPTARMLSGTREWLARWGVPVSGVRHLRPSEKAGYAQERGFLAFVEDRRETAVAMSAVCASFLVAMPYNELERGSSAERGVRRWEREQFLNWGNWLLYNREQQLHR